MKLIEAIKVISHHCPCPHDNYDTRFGDGQTWAICEDCGETFQTANLQRHQKLAKDFEEAMDCLNAIVKVTA
ncbi:hypothetical protein [Geobacter grbiciae]|uniref:hypothetical protein n=1 Tax=Geobacter grbiciae TaxID=155042 RepID=UPI001C020151|nr:hypothetical protein [Geobacter grbiciae]MBT1077067.1 hypothetical protein [Geobacter grbiciae]